MLGHVAGKRFSVKGRQKQRTHDGSVVIRGSSNETSSVFKIRLCFSNDEVHCVNFIQLELDPFNTITLTVWLGLQRGV